MKRIDELFSHGKKLYQMLDGSTPFRQKAFALSMVGRSWAIHDDILDEIDDQILDGPWYSPKMYKMVGVDKNICTFTDAKTL